MNMKKDCVVAGLVMALAGGCCVKSSCVCPCSSRASGDLNVSIFVSDVKRISIQRGVSYEESALLLNQAGVSGFDCSYLEPLLPRLSKSALRPINLYGGVDFCGADAGVAQEDSFIAAAVRYGVPRIMVIPDGFVAGDRAEACYGKIRDGLKRLVAKANAAGVTATIEDYGGTNNICSYAPYIKRLLTDVPDLKYALDSGNLYYAGRGEDILDLMRFADGKIAHVHLKDQTKEDNHKYATIGLGAVPNAAIVRYVAARGYDQWFTLENPLDPDRLSDVYRQIAVLRHWYATPRAE